MTLLSIAGLLAFLASSTVSGRAQTEDSVLVKYDLRAVMPRWDGGESWSQSLLVPPLSSRDFESIDESLEYSQLASIELVDLLTQILGDELRREGRELWAEDKSLTVLAPPALHEQVASILESLQMALAGTIPVRVDLFDLGDGVELPRAGVLAAEEASTLASTLTSKGVQLRSYTLELSPGRTARLDAYRRVPFLFDYDVEVAQSIVVFDPIMRATRDGTRLVMRGVSRPGGMSLSSVILRSDLLGEILRKPLTLRGVVNGPEGGSPKTIDGPDGIQSPEVLVRGLAFDSFLPDGKALALTVEASLGKAKTRELILIRRLGGTMSSHVSRPIPRTNRTLIALNVELFHAARLNSFFEPWEDEQGELQPNVVARFEAEPSGFLMEWMKARFSVWRRFGPWILIVTDPAWDRDAAAQLDRLVRSLRPTGVQRQVAIDLRSGEGEQGHPVRIRLPVLEGSGVGLVVARGETAVTEFDVEVAQGASVPDPIVSSIFHGLAMAFELEGTTLETMGIGLIFDSAILPFDTGYGMLGPIERSEPRVLRFDERLQLPEGRPAPVRIGSASERGGQPGLALELTVLPAPQ